MSSRIKGPNEIIVYVVRRDCIVSRLLSKNFKIERIFPGKNLTNHLIEANLSNGKRRELEAYSHKLRSSILIIGRTMHQSELDDELRENKDKGIRSYSLYLKNF
jgi:hypothetical protein